MLIFAPTAINKLTLNLKVKQAYVGDRPHRPVESQNKS